VVPFLAHELDPAGLDLIVDQTERGSLFEFFVVACFAEDAILREFEKGPGHSNAVRGQIGRRRRAAAVGCQRRLVDWHDCALLFTLLL
jgi:hypothetical protein